MALALYRKYRPTTFAEVIGQEHVTEPLIQALREPAAAPRVSVLRPPRLRQDVVGTDPGPVAQLRAGPDPRAVRDLRVVPARWRPTAPARSTSWRSTRRRTVGSTTPGTCANEPSSPRWPAATRSTSSTRRTWCPRQGFNALLKLVEEPPEFVKFVFATTEPDKVLPTIRSRTHHYPFRLIPPSVLRPYLEQLCAAEGRPGRAGGVPAGGTGRWRLGAGLPVGARPADRRSRPGRSHLHAAPSALLGVTDAALLDETVDALAAGDGAAVYAHDRPGRRGGARPAPVRR